MTATPRMALQSQNTTQPTRPLRAHWTRRVAIDHGKSAPLPATRITVATAPHAKIEDMATRAELHRELDALPEPQVPKARIVVEETMSEPDVIGLPEGWGQTLTGEPMPNVVAAVRRVRDER